MSNEAEFISGLIVKAPNEKAPEYVKAKLSIKRLELIAFLQTKSDEWINADVKVSQGGRWYAAIDTWRPESKGGERPQRQESRGGGGSSAPSRGDEPFPDDSIPFATCYGDF
ncbi:MAG: hypothetical protein A3E01_04610 [Gammaproteobacteria bacterium RIFCSPHIGHO2_12_FULL_63_22]|nr:MAG: hypothetical protein A3E01_04610 [Gammaproteobacteria bacterium RIFCSPHIGHO2_12_FULL_63_22]